MSYDQHTFRFQVLVSIFKFWWVIKSNGNSLYYFFGGGGVLQDVLDQQLVGRYPLPVTGLFI